jgi:hypothetical protein
LLVVTTSDLEQVTLEFIAERVAGDLITKDAAISHSFSFIVPNLLSFLIFAFLFSRRTCMWKPGMEGLD